MRHSWSRRATLVAASIVCFAFACGQPFGLLAPSADNVVDTLTLYALTDTPVRTPSGLVISNVGRAEAVRTDSTSSFDFAFDIDSNDRVLLFPTGALHLGQSSGAQLSTLPFDSIKIAPNGNYQLDSAIVLDADGVAVLHSRPTGCGVLLTASYFFYAKIHVIEIDPTLRWIKIEILLDTNCGYRGLEPGLPRH